MNLKIKTLFFVVVLLITAGVLFGVFLQKKKDEISKSDIELELWPHSGVGEQPLIKYQRGNFNSWYPWVEKINDFLKEYQRLNETRAHGTNNRVMCNDHTRLAENQVCDVPVAEFFPCTYENNYNYDSAGPCVFLKLNKILDWKPQTYNVTDMPENMPLALKQYIKLIGTFSAPSAWVSCEGESPADKENLGPLEYIPSYGFPAYYYPFTNKEGYLSPLVAVLIHRPRMHVVINIECKVWAKNIAYENGGSVHFKLMVD